MPRNKYDACMFCSDNPCTCEGAVKPKKSASKKKPVEQPKPAPVAVDVRAAMKATVEETLDQETLEALCNLEGILHPDELDKFSKQMDTHKPASVRWKERNASHN
jgi:hypothetical protein